MEILLGIIAGFGICALVLKIVPAVLRAFGVHMPKRMGEWQDEVEQAAIHCIHTDLEAARAKARLVELIGEIPKDFEPSAFLGCQVAAGVQREVLLRAEQEGLVTPGMVDRIFERHGGTNPRPVTEMKPESSVEPMVEIEVEHDNVRTVRRIGDRLVPRRQSK